jgi:hypothetical protein
LNASERLKIFVENIDTYIESKNYIGPKFNNDFKIAEDLDLATIITLSQDDCFNYAYMLYQYADDIALELTRNKAVLQWCETSLNEMVSVELINMPQIAKHEMKFAAILKENDLAKKLNEWKAVATSRIDFLQVKEYNVRRKADCLIEKGKRK